MTFDTGLSALRASQQALQVVSNNISNANTEGFHRRRTQFAALAPSELTSFRVGTGVTVGSVERIRDQVTEVSLTNAISDLSEVDQALVIGRQIETAFLAGSTSISDEVDQFFAEITRLTAAPDEPSQRAAVVEGAQRLTGVIRQAATQLEDLGAVVEAQITQEIDSLNQQFELLSTLSTRIESLSAQGFAPSAELDQRDALLNDIADAVGIQRNDFLPGTLNLRIGNAAIQQGGTSNQFSIERGADGRIEIFLDDSSRPLQLSGGRLAGLQDAFNTTIPKYADKLDQLSIALIQSVDNAHATGVGTAGGFQHLAGTRFVNDTEAALASAGAAFPISDGNITVSIVDADGVRRNETIAIDPEVDSLRDVADRFAAIDGLNAVVDPTSGQLQIFASEGVLFDFTGSIETHPDLVSFTGSAVPTFGGAYSREENRSLRFEVEGTGDVGISPDLFLNVFNDDGSLVRQINIGNGYEAGAELDIGDGVYVEFSRGTVQDGDTFTTQLIGQPDETGFLSSLGLNSFFEGQNATSISVTATILEDPSRFATGVSGDAADTVNLFRLVEIENQALFQNGLTISDFVDEIDTEIGFQVNTDAALSASLGSLRNRLQEERDSYSGVDLNEELIFLQEYQRSYEAAARVIQAADDILSELFSIIR